MKCYRENYPRPQLVRDNWQSLNGEWRFRFDQEDVGEREGWNKGFHSPHTITVPFTFETVASGIHREEPCSVIWYAREAELSALAENERLMLHFEGSDYHTKVWINGQFAGEHQGGYARFSMEIGNLCREGSNWIVVRVCDYSDAGQARGKQRWTAQNYGCWYVQTTGIWKTVWLERTPEVYIKQLKMTPNLQEYKLIIEALIEAGDRKGYTLEAKAGYQDIPAGNVAAGIRGRRIRVELDLYNTQIDEWGVKLWSPQSPELYDIELCICRDGKIIDRIGSYFGMREISIKGSRVLLNNAPLYQKLILDQGYWTDTHLTPPDEQALIFDIECALKLGYNGVRKHQKIEDERYLYWCDVKGLLVWSEMAAAYTFHDTAVEGFTREWMEILQQNYNHPCIITWVPFNESWGIPHVRTRPDQQAFTQAVYHLTKAFDTMRPVIVNDGWEHTISDIITLHDYQESGEAFLEKYTDRLSEILESRIPHSDYRFAFADSFGYRGQPIMISEYGGIAFSTKDGWGYGKQVASEDSFIERFRSITEAIQQIPQISGYCYTQLTHVQQEQNGLMDEKRRMIADPDTIAEINRKRKEY